MVIGDKVKQLRKEKGWTQEQLGEMVGVKKAAINKYETGNVKNLKRNTIAGLAKALGVSPVWLMDDSQDWPPVYVMKISSPEDDQQRLEALHQNPKLGILFDHARNMSEKDVDFLVQMAERMSKDIYGDD